MHTCLNKFNFWQDLTTDNGIICSWASEKSTFNLVATLAPLFLVDFFLFLHIKRITIISRMTSNLSQIRSWTMELVALEFLEKSPYTYNERNVVATLAHSFLTQSSSFLQY